MRAKDWASLGRLDAMAQAELCARGELSPEELFEACLARVDALNPLLRAAVTVVRDRPTAKRSSPLHGVPFLAKDALAWPGLRWSMGSRALAHQVARAETPYVRRLVEAGLVCMGKSAMSELGLLASTETLLEGATHNPWDLSRSPGGSSGGSAVAVAAGLVPIAHANDGGGSIRIPASACGVFGFKPSRGRTVSSTFATSDFLDLTSDHCITRSVRDSALFLALTEDRDASAPVGFVRDPIARPLRIATFSRGMFGHEPDAAVRRALDEAARLLEELGHRVEPIAPPAYESEALADAFFVVAAAGVAALVESLDRTRGTPVQERELEPFTWALIEDLDARGPDALPRARAAFARAVHAHRDATRGADVLLTPTVGSASWPLGHLSPLVDRAELVRRTARINGYAPIHNVLGAPAMTVPLHFTDDGVPVGVHFAAAPGQDALLLGLAHQLERARPWRDRWPPFSIPARFSSDRQ